MPADFFDYHIPYMTTRIENKQKREMGTGFLYQIEIPNNNGVNYTVLLLISNKHVLEGNSDEGTELTIKLNRKKGDGTPDFGNLITLDRSWNLYTHPNPHVDLACVDVSEIKGKPVFYEHFGVGILTPINYKKVTIGKEILFVGYPGDFYDVGNNLPLGRAGIIASAPDVDFRTIEQIRIDAQVSQIIIDAQVFPGSSGSPVFVDWDDKYSLLGVISHTRFRRSGIEPLLESMPEHSKNDFKHLETILQYFGVKEVIGLGIVIKQRHVIELIEYVKSYVMNFLEVQNQLLQTE